ncbi:hypothetical protein MHY85_10415 [Cellulomonas sp. ACRRI]|uniref:hypothetical protein n=1 Tax=Cellulomonas sp. ACRRI TaxID=2918188 RepID=UPI001EF37A2C|nr:hypothetical protein [Cellulomonas sp. ACRRI]MCG7286381.1 hypothetical protein [Cellulomonas sp. ACRRI]
MTGNDYRYRQREAREIQRELGVPYSEALRIWAERNPERAEKVADSKRQAKQDARSRTPEINLDKYLDSVQGLTLEQLGLESPAELVDAYVVEAEANYGRVTTKLVSLNNTGLALWRGRATTRLTLAGTTPGSQGTGRDTRMFSPPTRLAHVTFAFSVKDGRIVRQMQVRWTWAR